MAARKINRGQWVTGVDIATPDGDWVVGFVAEQRPDGRVFIRQTAAEPPRPARPVNHISPERVRWSTELRLDFLCATTSGDEQKKWIRVRRLYKQGAETFAPWPKKPSSTITLTV